MEIELCLANEGCKMLKFFLTILLFISLTAWELPNLIRKKEKKEWIVFFLLMLIGIVLSILFLFDVFL